MSPIEAENAPPPSIQELEDSVARTLFPKVRNYLDLLGGAWSMSLTAFKGAYPERDVPLDKMVCTKLLMRLNNDLRAMMMLSEVGYDAQANSLAASAYEGAFTIAAIAGDEQAARNWLEHDNPKDSFAKAKTLTITGLERYGAHDGWVEPLYKTYRQFCWGKHLNPIAEQQGGIEWSAPNTLDYVPGPRDDELTERGIAFCSVHSCLFAIIGIEMFVRHYALPESRKDILISLAELGKKREELNERALATWNSPDPFPGKW